MAVSEGAVIIARSIGYAVRDGRFCRLILSGEGQKGLKELHYFSHLYLFLDRDGKPEARLCQIVSVDEEGGRLLLFPGFSKPFTPIFDIKPYIPIEDRVAQPVSPGMKSQTAGWFEDCTVPVRPLPGLWQKMPGEEITVEWSSIGSFNKKGARGSIRFHRVRQDQIREIEGYSHVRVLWLFDRFLGGKYREIYRVRPPYPGAPKVGVFASRSPVRPNPVAMTTARLLFIDVDGGWIEVGGMDAADGSPVLAVVAYVAEQGRVENFAVPPWAAHWPEWYNESDGRESEPAKERKESHAAVIKAIIGDEPDPPGSPDLFWQMTEEGEKTKEADDVIRITGARQNNLKNLSVSIPKNKFTVITGVSGSGKSSLVFDTLYAESQRRFVDTLSTLGRQAFGDIEKPDVDGIAGLPYTIAIEQKSMGRNVRSTVGTVTEIFDFLRLLYSRVSRRYCPDCGEEIAVLHHEELIDTATGLAAIRGLTITEYRTGHVLLKIDRRVRGEDGSSLREKVGEAVGAANHTVRLVLDDGREFILSSHPLCPRCNRVFFQMTSSFFSPNHPDGMCPECKGLGKLHEVDPERIVSRPDLSLLDGASPWWGDLRAAIRNPSMNWMRTEILALARHLDVDLELPWRELPEEFRQKALYGTDGEKLAYRYDSKTTGRSGVTERPVYGAVNHIKRLLEESSSPSAHAAWFRFMREKECAFCEGEKLSGEGRMAVLAGLRYPEVAHMSISGFLDWIHGLPGQLDNNRLALAEDVLREIRHRCLLLVDVGLGYLGLDRQSSTLSGGEAQRIRLAGQLGCGLNNLLYVLDEPSMGLHPRDHARMLQTIKESRDGGNTVVVVEHDASTMRAADFIIDMGPGAGRYGGEIIASGTPREIMCHPDSGTGAYLSGKKRVVPEDYQRVFEPYGWLRVKGANVNNLKSIDVAVPLGCIAAVTGVSGSGKSSLVHQVICPSVGECLGGRASVSRFCCGIEGTEGIDKLIMVDQSPIGRTPRSNPASYTGLWDGVRSLFASTPEAKRRGYGPNRFSFNNKEGACLACQGDGRMRTEMHFMPDVWSVCPRCRGKRFRPEILEILWNGVNVADVLDMEIASAQRLFYGHGKVYRILRTLSEVGLGYLKLGQSALDLSGGEAQRVKLARELCRPDTGRTLYVLDEPTTGLHFEDLRYLLNLFFRLKKKGNTILFVEHNLDLIAAADYIIDLGPEGGEGGGYVVVQGTAEEVMNTPESYTGHYLRREMGQSGV